MGNTLIQTIQQKKKFGVSVMFYGALSVLTFANEVLWKHEFLAVCCRVVLYMILFYKGIVIWYRYYKTASKGYVEIEKKAFRKKYRGFRTKVSLWWIAFAVICGVAKHIWMLSCNFYFALAFCLLAVDLIFVKTICLLQLFSDPKAKVVKCCCGCPLRGWDLLMINTPLIFAFRLDNLFEDILTVIAIFLGVVSFIYWEKYKYILVEDRSKCQSCCELKLCREYLEIK